MLKCLNAKMGESGFAALLLAILILVIILALAVSILFLTIGEQRIVGNITRSLKAYYLAEAGIEDSLLRIFDPAMQYSLSNTLSFRDGNTTILISGPSNSLAIESRGGVGNRIRKVRVEVELSTSGVNFYYGVQVGDLGLQMDSNTGVHGNVFSNGTMRGSSNARIYGDAISAGPGGSIRDLIIDSSEGGGNAWAFNLRDCTIGGDAHYTTISNCSVGGTQYTPETPVDPQSMPISDLQITDWKNDAAAGGTIPSYSLGGNNTASLGPIKVEGDMTLDSNAILTITGTIWVTGNMSLNSNVVLQLDPAYGPLSGILVVDGQISVDSNVRLCGSSCDGSTGSYLMLLSTNNSTDPDNPAILASSNTNTAILYTSDGFTKLRSNAVLKEATGYGVALDSNAVVTYETGLADVRFSSGPSGGWEVKSWKEIE